MASGLEGAARSGRPPAAPGPAAGGAARPVVLLQGAQPRGGGGRGLARRDRAGAAAVLLPRGGRPPVRVRARAAFPARPPLCDPGPARLHRARPRGDHGRDPDPAALRGGRLADPDAAALPGLSLRRPLSRRLRPLLLAPDGAVDRPERDGDLVGRVPGDLWPRRHRHLGAAYGRAAAGLRPRDPRGRPRPRLCGDQRPVEPARAHGHHHGPPGGGGLARPPHRRRSGAPAAPSSGRPGPR